MKDITLRLIKAFPFIKITKTFSNNSTLWCFNDSKMLYYDTKFYTNTSWQRILYHWCYNNDYLTECYNSITNNLIF